MSTKTSKTINFSTVWDSDYWMSSNGMYCGFNMPPALVSNKKGENEFAQGLPPYNKRKFYLSDEYPAVPKNWVPSEGRKTSYFVPVKEGEGMWLDFNKNSSHKYEVAIVISVQGINPITGLPCTDAGLEQYIDTCPKHKIAFGPNRYCEKCGYKWPKQNYISTTGTPNGQLWLDGFRSADGVVKQYVLTMDKIKGVAANILKEERVFAVGVSFFLSNNPKYVAPQQTVLRGNCYTTAWAPAASAGACGAAADSDTVEDWQLCDDTRGISKGITNTDLVSGSWDRKAFCYSAIDVVNTNSIDTTKSCTTAPNFKSRGRLSSSASSSTSSSLSSSSSIKAIQSVSVKKVEIGKGASIDQQVYDDPEPLEFWRKEPEAVICINYCLEADCAKIINAGKISLEGHKESFLKDIPAANEVKEMA